MDPLSRSHNTNSSNASPTRLRMRVGGMTCTDCERHVSEALREAGAINPVADFRRAEARFTTPAIATVGFTEEQARRAGHEVKSSVLPLHAVPRALVNRDEKGVFKVVADARTDEVLGVHVVTENAGDVIYAGVLAVKFHLTVRDLTDSFAPYLTMSEGLKLAAQSFSRDPSKLSCCAA